MLSRAALQLETAWLARHTQLTNVRDYQGKL